MIGKLIVHRPTRAEAIADDEAGPERVPHRPDQDDDPAAPADHGQPATSTPATSTRGSSSASCWRSERCARPGGRGRRVQSSAWQEDYRCRVASSSACSLPSRRPPPLAARRSRVATYNVEHFESHFTAHRLAEEPERVGEGRPGRQGAARARTTPERRGQLGGRAGHHRPGVQPRRARHPGGLHPGQPRLLQQALAQRRVRDRHRLPDQHRPQAAPRHAAQAGLQGRSSGRTSITSRRTPSPTTAATACSPAARRSAWSRRRRVPVLGRRDAPEEQVRQQRRGDRVAQPRGRPHARDHAGTRASRARPT